ncbi:S8 family peptidase [Christensenellaceae bacterium OttesenSCG-928-M15]|nr:S8 family peptidase [Christensenellaceae bacterium OttesenSCG-928-M15]
METTDRHGELTKEGFFEREDVVDFIIHYSEFVQSELNQRPYVVPGKEITGNYAVIYLPENRIDESLTEIGANVISLYPIIMGLLGEAELASAGILPVQQQPYLDLRGRGVLVGIVDTGIDYTNEVFRHEDGTSRVKYIWDQTISASPPPEYHYGSEYTQAQINEALRSDTPFSIVPERDTVGHGTFLASVAAGGGNSENTKGAAPDSELIVVKLRKAKPYHLNRYLVPEWQQNAFSSSDVILGVEYILERAASLRMPVAICLGIGSNFGGHDGYNIFEEYLAQASNRTGVAICNAAGNEAIARHHMQGKVASMEAPQNVEVLAVDNAGAISVQLWNTAADRLSVSVTSPTGEMLNTMPAKSGTKLESSFVLEKSRVSIEYFFPLPGSGGQLSWIKIFDPTPGIWTISVHGDSILEGTFHAWLPMTGFVAPGVEFLTPSPNTTITVPATSFGLITVGAYSTQTKGLYANSSWGPTRQPALSPDFVAPGVDAGGMYPTGPGAMTGTSVAAAVTAGACALMLQWGIVERNEISLNSYLIRAYLIRGCERDPGIAFPNDQWGYGRLNLMNTFIQLRGG